MKNAYRKIILVFVVLIIGFVGTAIVSVATRQPKELYELLSRRRMHERTLAEIARQEELERNDPYGGATPEETFALFLDALRAGDTDLASKYFVLEKQEEWRENLEKVKKAGHLTIMTTDLSKAEYDQTQGSLAWFSLPGKDKQGNIIYSRITFNKAINNKWKLSKI